MLVNTHASMQIDVHINGMRIEQCEERDDGRERKGVRKSEMSYIFISNQRKLKLVHVRARVMVFPESVTGTVAA